MNNKVVIVGCGNVGMSYAYSLLNQRTYVNELVLIDINTNKTIGEAMDLNHGLAYSPSKIKIYAGDYNDCHDAKIVVIAAGANQNVGETRMDLIYKNSNIFKDIINKIMNSGFKGIFIIATNPVDVLTYQTWLYSKMEPNKVIGTGTTLDTARLRYEISEKIHISPKNVHAYVLGEHGDSEFVSWRNSMIGANNINEFISETEKDEIEEKVRTMAYDIINRKGNTSYGIGMSLTRITNAILGDENTILTISSYDPINKIFIGYPTIINKNGADRRLDMHLSENEKIKMETSIKTIKEAISKIAN